MSEQESRRVDAVISAWRIYGLDDDYLSARSPDQVDWVSKLRDYPIDADATVLRQDNAWLAARP